MYACMNFISLLIFYVVNRSKIVPAKGCTNVSRKRSKLEICSQVLTVFGYNAPVGIKKQRMIQNYSLSFKINLVSRCATDMVIAGWAMCAIFGSHSCLLASTQIYIIYIHK